MLLSTTLAKVRIIITKKVEKTVENVLITPWVNNISHSANINRCGKSA